MPIRKGKLWKPCKKCGTKFEPASRGCKICDECYKASIKKIVAWRRRFK